MAVAVERATTVDEQVERANSSVRAPVVFIHGLWLLPSSWERWASLFEASGYAAVMPGWPGDPPTVSEARAHPGVLSRKTVGQVADHVDRVVRSLKKKPAVVGHSFGGLLTQIIAGRGHAATSVAIDPAPHRGVLPLPFAALRSAWPVLGNPANRGRAVSLTFEQFRFGWGNALAESEARQLYDEYQVPGAGAPVFQAAAANVNPWTEVKVDVSNPNRGPLLVIEGGADHTVPPSIALATYNRQKRNPGVTEYRLIPGRGHSLVIDGGWQDVAEVALAFVKRSL